VTPKTPQAPGGAGGPHDPLVGEGSRLPPSLTPAVAEGGSDVPGAAVAEADLAGEGQERQGGTRPLGSTLAERQREQLARIKAARSALAKGQRQQRARRNPPGITGIRVPPPGGSA
jgi:hypothetical protein